MYLSGRKSISIVVATSLVFGVMSYSAGQDRTKRESAGDIGGASAGFEDEIPESALLTDRGSQLALRLRILRQSEQAMGEKHPQYESVQEEIKNIKRELAAWASLEDAALELDPTELQLEVPMMSDRDLRQLVLQLAGKIAQLEDRVTELERRPVDL